ncbi:unnamed protein product [Rotaria socialis]
MIMDYLTERQERGQIYEFPYSGHTTHSTPFLSYNTNGIPSNNYSPLDNFLHHPQPNFNTSITSQMPSMLGSNTLVFQVPDYVPLDTILKQLGVDIHSMHRSPSGYNYHNNPSSSLELSLPPRASRHRSLICREFSDSESDNRQGYLSDNQRRMSGRRRRLICREISDSESDNDQGRSSYRRRGRHGSNSAWNRKKQRPPGIHNLLGNVWKQARNPTKNGPQSNSNSTLNPQWRDMVKPATPPQQPTGANNAWQAMLNNATPPQQQPTGVNNVWQAMQNNATPPQQQPTGANNAWQTMLNNAAPPQQPTGVNNVWQAMQNPSAPISPQQGNPGVNNVWNKTKTAPDENTGFLARFRRKPSTTSTVFQPPPFQQNQAAMNNFPAADNLQAGANQRNPALANMQSNVNNFQQQGPPLTSIPPPTMNPAWNMMSRG